MAWDCDKMKMRWLESDQEEGINQVREGEILHDTSQYYCSWLSSFLNTIHPAN